MVEEDGIQTVAIYSDGAYHSSVTRFGWGNNYALRIRPVDLTDVGNFTCDVTRTDDAKLKNVTVLGPIYGKWDSFFFLIPWLYLTFRSQINTNNRPMKAGDDSGSAAPLGICCFFLLVSYRAAHISTSLGSDMRTFAFASQPAFQQQTYYVCVCVCFVCVCVWVGRLEACH